MRKKPINEMKLSFASRSVNEAFARSAAAAFACQLDPTLDELADIKTAVSEAVTNAIIHGYRHQPGTVTLGGKMYEDGTLTFTVTDRGCGMENIHQAMEPLFTGAPNEERAGMGFVIMQSFMDKVSVASKPGKGTRVTLQRRLRRRR